MKKITNILLLVLLAAVIVLAAAVIYLYQRDGSPSSPVSGTPSASQSESITVGTPAPSGGEAEGGDSSGDTNGPEVGTPAESGGEDAQAAVTELRCSAALGAVKIVEGAEFGLSEGSEAECEAYIEDNAYVVSASTTQDIPIVVTVPEGITFEQVTLTASGGNLTVEGIDTEALSTSCTQGAIYYSGRLDGSADVEHLQGQTVCSWREHRRITTLSWNTAWVTFRWATSPSAVQKGAVPLTTAAKRPSRSTAPWAMSASCSSKNAKKSRQNTRMAWGWTPPGHTGICLQRYWAIRRLTASRPGGCCGPAAASLSRSP